MPSDLLRRPDQSSVLREHQSVVSADPARLVVVQGGWWYRAEYRVAADAAGARIHLTLVNVASPAHWAGPLTGRAVIRSSARDFGDMVDRVRAAV